MVTAGVTRVDGYAQEVTMPDVTQAGAALDAARDTATADRAIAEAADEQLAEALAAYNQVLRGE
jgi:hypothetical protein